MNEHQHSVGFDDELIYIELQKDLMERNRTKYCIIFYKPPKTYSGKIIKYLQGR